MTSRPTPTGPGSATVWPWLILPLRLVLFAVFQAIFSLFLLGSPDPWSAAAAWWPFAATLTNGVTIAALVILYRQESSSFSAQLRIASATARSDIALMAGLGLVALVLVTAPNIGFAMLLFGNSDTALDLLVRPLPLWAIYVALATFPLSTAIAELPTYFRYVMPRLQTATGSGLVAVLLPAVFLAAQHVTLPLLFDWQFALWRFLMFLPFALFAGFILRWRTRLLPYFVIIHVVMDAATIPLFLSRIG